MIILSSVPHGGKAVYATYSGETVIITGYPEGMLSIRSNPSTSYNYKTYYIFPSPGMSSGSNISHIDNSNVVGIHAYAYSLGSGGIRITSTIKNQITS